MPEPTTAWMVHLMRGITPQDVRGILSTDGDALVFAADEGGSFRLAFVDVRRVKRLRMSPVLLLHWQREGAERHTAFYFTPPPPLPDSGKTAPEDGPAPLRAALTSSTRRRRRRNSVYLSTVGGQLRPTLVEWEAELRERIAAAGGRGR
jgi:hypothetical protein